MEKINELDWCKLQLAEARAEIAQLKLDALKKDLVMAYSIKSTDRVNPDSTIVRGIAPEVEKLA